MSELPPIVIPPDLLPTDGRFGSGPSKVPEESVWPLLDNSTGLLGRSHRSGVFTEQVARLTDGIQELLDVPEGHIIAFGNGGATTFWEIAGLGLVRERSQHIVEGSFSKKWAEAVEAIPGVKTSTISSRSPRIAAPSPFLPNISADAYALTQNETSVGIKTEIKRPDDPEVIVMVDGVSAAGATEVDITQTDAYFFSLQKAFASEGGVWAAVLSPAALERQQQIAKTGRYIPKVLDLGIAVSFAKKNQTYNTPALTSIFLAAEWTEALLQNGGLSVAAKRSADMAQTVYSWAEHSDFAEPFILNPADRSTTTPVVQINGIEAAKIAKILERNGIFDTAGYRGISEANMLRFATFPAIEPSDIEALLGCVDYVAEALAA